MNKRTLTAAVALFCVSIAGSAVNAHTQKKAADKKPVKSSGKVVITKSGLRYEHLVVGKGASPKNGHTVSVHYTRWLTDGNKSTGHRTRGLPFQYPVGQGRASKGGHRACLPVRIAAS